MNWLQRLEYWLDSGLRNERRDKAARAALAGMLATPTGMDPKTAAQWAYDYAEAMEAARAKRLQ